MYDINMAFIMYTVFSVQYEHFYIQGGQKKDTHARTHTHTQRERGYALEINLNLHTMTHYMYNSHVATMSKTVHPWEL
jgi:hypothetical protein